MNQKNCCGKCCWALAFLVAYLFIGAYALLWSWNINAELFKWPVAEYRHALAAMLVFIVIALPFNRRFRHSHDGYCMACGCRKDDSQQKSQ